MADKSADKKQQILATAMQLFAVKGASATSMQELAELCGMSKGSLYLYFKSKEELVQQLQLYCLLQIRDPLVREEQENNKPEREKLRNQVEILLHHVYELREFLQRQIQDAAESGMTGLPDWMKETNGALIQWFEAKMKALYGPGITPYTGDLVLVVHGMLNSYLRLIFHPDALIPLSRMADHLVEHMDIVTAGLLSDRPAPLLSKQALERWIGGSIAESPRSPLQLVKEMKSRLGELAEASKRVEEASESLSILEGELLVPYPRKAIITGMLHNLESVPELDSLLAEFKHLVRFHE